MADDLDMTDGALEDPVDLTQGLASPTGTGLRPNAAQLARMGTGGVNPYDARAEAMENNIQKAIEDRRRALVRQQQELVDPANKLMAEAQKPTPRGEAQKFNTEPPSFGMSQDEMKNMLSTVTALAAVGGMLTRRPLTAMLGNFSAGVNGFVQGKMQDYKMQMDQFKINFEKAKADHDEYWKALQSGIEASKGDLAKMQVVLQTKAMQYGQENDIKGLDIQGLQTQYGQILRRAASFESTWEKVQRLHEATQNQVENRLERRRAAQVHEQETERHNREMEESKAARTPKISQKDAQSLAAIEQNVSRIDSILKQVEARPGVTGVTGLANRWYERIAPQLGVGISGTPANDFETAMGVLKGSMYKELVGAGNISKAEWTRIDNILKGLSWSDSPDVVKGAMNQVKGILRERGVLQRATPSIVSEAKDMLKKGYAASDLMEFARSRGYRLSSEDLE